MNNLIGVSLPWDYLSENNVTNDALVLKKLFSHPSDCLDFLKKQGVSVIELRHRSPKLTVEDMIRVLKLLNDNGLKITIHGEVYPHSDDWTLYDLLPWMKAAGSVLPESSEIMITLHPVSDAPSDEACRQSTINYLKRMAEEVNDKPIKYRLALENQRKKGALSVGTSFPDIAQMREETGNPEIGVCWDMGHGHANYIQESPEYTLLPPPEFVSETIHTHIHDLGPDGRTHWPFLEKRIPLVQNVDLLQSAGYKGIYNLELSFERFESHPDIKGSLKDSIGLLRQLISREVVENSI